MISKSGTNITIGNDTDEKNKKKKTEYELVMTASEIKAELFKRLHDEPLYKSKYKDWLP